MTQIKPLPNLDYNVVTGNSLLGIEMNLFNTDMFTRLEELKPLYFDATDRKQKEAFKHEIDDLIHKPTGGKETFDFKIYVSEIFHRKRGVDVVIGNLPYAVSKDKTLRRIYHESVFGRPNLYGFFIHASIRNLMSEVGVLTLINPRTLLRWPLPGCAEG